MAEKKDDKFPEYNDEFFKKIADTFSPKTKTFQQIAKNVHDELITGVESTAIRNYEKLSTIMGGFRPSEFTILCGSTGCLSGDTKIRVNRGGKGFELTIRDMYSKWSGFNKEAWDLSIPTFVRSFDGRVIRLHKIKDVFLSGIKETIRITCGNGITIRVTRCHKMLTQRGWVAANDLLKSDKLASDSIKPRKTKTQRANKLVDTYFSGLKFHPFRTHKNIGDRIISHRAIYEAHFNKMELNEYLDILKCGNKKIDSMTFFDPKKFHIHHKNHNHFDNSVDNLELLSTEDHMEHHGNADYFGSGTIQWVPFLKHDLPGVEPVYDISCEDPHHNFSANRLIVHNSGKTTLCANLSASFLVQKIPQLILSVETGPTDYVRRVISALDQKDYNDGEPITKEARDLLFKKWGTYLDESDSLLGLYTNRVHIKNLLAELIQAANRGVKIAFLDNLNYFLEVTSAQNQLIETDKVLHELIILTKCLPLHCVLIMHPKKTETGRVEDEFDIKGSSTAVQEAFNVLLFNRPSRAQIENGVCEFSDRELKLVKSRHRGKHVGTSIILGQKNSVFYYEKAKYTFQEMKEKTNDGKFKKNFTE